MYTCMYVYMEWRNVTVLVYTYMCICIFFLCTCTWNGETSRYLFTHVYMCVNVYSDTCIYVHMHSCIHAHVCICMCAYTAVYTHVCVHVCVRIHVQLYTRTCVHVCVGGSTPLCHIIIHTMSHHHTYYVTSSYILKERLHTSHRRYMYV